MSAIPVVDRILRRVHREADGNGCWSFQGALVNGYGTVNVSRQTGTRQVHRILWEHHNGPIPPRHDIHHRCGNRSCCNPAHLEAMPHSEHPKKHPSPKQDTCRRGHPMREPNLYFKAGNRSCRQCCLDREKERKRKFRELHPLIPRTHCRSGRHLWIPENQMKGGKVKRCRLCHNEKQNRKRGYVSK